MVGGEKYSCKLSSDLHNHSGIPHKSTHLPSKKSEYINVMKSKQGNYPCRSRFKKKLFIRLYNTHNHWIHPVTSSKTSYMREEGGMISTVTKMSQIPQAPPKTIFHSRLKERCHTSPLVSATDRARKQIQENVLAWLGNKRHQSPGYLRSKERFTAQWHTPGTQRWGGCGRRTAGFIPHQLNKRLSQRANQFIPLLMPLCGRTGLKKISVNCHASMDAGMGILRSL